MMRHVGTAEQEDSDDFAAEFTAASSDPSAETRGTDVGKSTAEQTEPDEPIKTAQAEVGTSAESTNTGTGGSSSGRERAYLKERNTVLSTKLEQQEATIDELQDRVETLEAELAALRPSESDEKSREQSAQQQKGKGNPRQKDRRCGTE